MGDKIELLKKVEITFHELSERRKVYALETGKILKEKEDTLNGIRRTKRIDKKNAELEAREDEKRRLIKEKQMKRDQMVQFVQKKTTARSKPKNKQNTVKKVETVNQEDQDMINYIGAEVLQIMKEKGAQDNQSQN